MNELYHRGIKGQKWGVRRYQNPDGTLTAAGKNRYNENYTPDQRIRDQLVYGKGGVKRINRTMNETGSSIFGARSVEADRINSARRTATTTRSIGRTAGALAGSVAGYIGYEAAKSVMRSSSNPTMQAIAATLDNNFIADTALTVTVSSGSANLAAALGQYGGQSIGMLSKGYSPSKYRK